MLSKITFKREQARCIWFTDQDSGTGPRGQQCSQWMSAGKFQPIGREVVTISTLNQGMVTDEFVRFHDDADCVLYVHPAFLKGVDVQNFPLIPSV